MIRSMTGFGLAEKHLEGWSLRCEIRSVNHKGFKATLCVPDGLRFRENDLEKMLRESIARGHVYFSLECSLDSAGAGDVVNERELERYLGLFARLARKGDLPLHIDLSGLLRLPGVVKAEPLDSEIVAGLWPHIVEVTENARDAMVRTRQAEGGNLGAQLLQLCADIRSRAGSIKENSAELLKHYQERLRSRLEGLLDGTGVRLRDEDMYREVAFFAERSDVSEELARVASHLDQLEEAVQGSTAAAGRKLEFLAQEMFREANTMASKIPDGEQLKQVLEIKMDVERLREQLQNVE